MKDTYSFEMPILGIDQEAAQSAYDALEACIANMSLSEGNDVMVDACAVLPSLGILACRLMAEVQDDDLRETILEQFCEAVRESTEEIAAGKDTHFNTVVLRHGDLN